jgi:outer membrane protein assembly factor BamB
MGSLSGVMTAYDIESGRVLWSEQEKTQLGAPVEFFNDHVAYGGVNGRLFVRHYLTGKLKYSIDLSSPIESAPFFFNDRLLIYLRGHQLVELDAETGKVLWAYNRAVPVSTTLQRTTRPLIIGNKIIVGFADGYVGALSVQEGLLLWETKVVDNAKFVDADLNPLLASNTIIAGSPSGDLKAINPENGAISLSFGVSVMAHPVLKGNQLLLGTNDGEVILMGLDGQVVKRVKLSAHSVSAVSWWKNNIVATSFDGILRVIDPITFKVIDRFALGHEFSSVFSDLITEGDYLAIYTSRNRLYLFN